MPEWCQVVFRRGGIAVPLDECSFVLPLHTRGTAPPRVEIKQGLQRYEEFAALAAAEGVLEIEVVTPDATGEFVPSTIRCYDILRVHRGGGDVCIVELVDCRRELAWHTCTQDINLKLFTGYIPGTGAGVETEGANSANPTGIPMTIKVALTAISALPPLNGRMMAGTLDTLPDTPIRDDIYIAGMQMDKAIDVLEQNSGVDLVVNPATREYQWKARQGVNDAVSADWNAFSWRFKPGWLNGTARRTGIPKTVIAQYRRRVTLHVIDIQTYSDGGTAVGKGWMEDLPGVPRAVLQQVYDFAGHWLTLPNMLEAAGYPRDAIDEAKIAEEVMEDNWVHTALFFGKRPSTVERGIDAIVRKAIKDGHRKYYALRFLNKNNKDIWGGFSAVMLGQQNVGGGFRAGQVFCDWTEVLPKAKELVEGDPGWVRNAKTYRMVFEHRQGVAIPESPLEDIPFKWTSFDDEDFDAFTVAPFKMEWEDENHGIIKFVADKARIRGSTAFIGRPTEASMKVLSKGVGKTGSQVEKDIQEVQQAGIDALPTETIRGLQFRPTYRINAFISAVLEAPQGITGIGNRFLERRRNFEGDVEEIRLPVPEKPEAIHGPADTGTSPPLNTAEIDNDATQRATDFVDELRDVAHGLGETLDVHLVPADMPATMVGSELRVNENVITLVVEMGNEGNPAARMRTAAKREAGRKFKLAGKESG